MGLEGAGNPSVHDTNYSPVYLQGLFDDLSGSYELVSTLSSLGLTELWRRNAAHVLRLKQGMVVGDFMGGTGESWKHLLPFIGPDGHIFSIDFSKGMINGAEQRKQRNRYSNVSLMTSDATTLPFEDNSLDAIFSGYGVKTLCSDLHNFFAKEMKRVLKPGGRFATVEITVPSQRALQRLQHLYMYKMMPLAFALFDGHYDRFLMINRYLADFGDGSNLTVVFDQVGLSEVESLPMSGGLATIITG